MNRGELEKKDQIYQKTPENDFKRIYPSISDIQMEMFLHDEQIEDVDYMVISCEPKIKEKCLPKINLTVTGKITILSGEK